MDHATIAAHDLYEAYLAERLSEEEREAFEAHYFDCEECLRELELAEDFRAGMGDVRTEATAGLAGSGSARVAAQEAAPLGLLAALALLSRARRMALGGALLLLLALPAALLWRVANPEPPTQQARVPSSSERRIAGLESRLRSLEGSATAERRSLEAELARERLARADAERRAVPGPQIAQIQPLPQVNVPLFTLAAVRSAEAGREPVTRLPVPAGAGAIVVTLELATVEHAAYRTRLRSGAGAVLRQVGGLHPNGRDTLVLLLPSPLLRPGAYELILEGERPGDRPVTIGSYPFRVVRQP